jgi:hypothetical protein
MVTTINSLLGTAHNFNRFFYRRESFTLDWVMSKNSKPGLNITEVIDRIENIREELLTIQRSLESLEPRRAEAQSASSASEAMFSKSPKLK